MNCTICESYGKCKVWKSEKEFYKNFPAEKKEPIGENLCDKWGRKYD